MYQAVLVHRAERDRYRAGQEDFTLHILSSRHAEQGHPLVLLERQDDPAAGLVSRAPLRAALLTRLCQVLAVTPVWVLARLTGTSAAPAADSARSV
jgi:hypothetical protein